MKQNNKWEKGDKKMRGAEEPRKRPFLVLVLSKKGGPGKTTLVSIISAGAENAGEKVLVVDYDQGVWGSRSWYERRLEKGRAQIEAARWARKPTGMLQVDASSEPLQAELDGADWDIVLFDPPGGLDNVYVDSILSRIDLVVIPVKPTCDDPPTNERVFEKLDRLRVPVPALVVINGVYRGKKYQDDVRDIRESLPAGIAMASAQIPQSTEVFNSRRKGLTPPEMFPEGNVAACCKELTREFLRFRDGQH